MKKAGTISVLVVLTVAYLMPSESWAEIDFFLFICLVLVTPVSIAMGIIAIETFRLMT